MIGYVYVLSNPSMPNIYKIGCTSNSVNTRIAELSSSTNIPTPFEEAYSFIVPDMEKAEAILHNELKEYRVNLNREFFKIDDIKILDEAFGSIFENYQSFLHKFSEDTSFAGKEYYKKNYICLLDTNYKRLRKNDYNFEFFSDIFKKGNKYYRALNYTQVCTEDQYDKWVASKKILDSEDNSKIIIIND